MRRHVISKRKAIRCELISLRKGIMKRKIESIDKIAISYARMMQSLNDTIEKAKTEGPGLGGRRFLLSEKITSYGENLLLINCT